MITNRHHKITKLFLLNVLISALLIFIMFGISNTDLSTARPYGTASVALAQADEPTQPAQSPMPEDPMGPPAPSQTPTSAQVTQEVNNAVQNAWSTVSGWFGGGGASTNSSNTGGADGDLLPPPVLDAPQPNANSAGGSGSTRSNSDCTSGSCKFDNPLGQSGSLETFLNRLLDVVILIGAIAVVLSIIMAGLKYVTANGDEKKISSAHTQLLWTLVGAGILLSAKVIAMIVQNTVRALS